MNELSLFIEGSEALGRVELSPTVTLDDVEDIETLRRAAKILEAEVQELVNTVTKLKRRVFELEHGKPEQLELQKIIDDLEDKLARRNQLLFGDSLEKRPSDKPKAAPKKKQTGHGRRRQPELEEVEQIHVANVEDDMCDLCGGA